MKERTFSRIVFWRRLGLVLGLVVAALTVALAASQIAAAPQTGVVARSAAAFVDAPPALTLTGEDTGNILGFSVAGAGDVNGDGYADFVVGAPGYNGGQGRVYVYHGAAGGVAATPALTLTGETATSFGGAVAGAGDVNGDGYADLVIGAYGYNNNRGRAYVYLGSAGGVIAAPALTLTGETNGSYFGGSVASAGDINGDGYSDLVVGADGYNGNQGRAYIYLGNSGGVTATPARRLTGEATDNFFGFSVASAGDVNGDGYADLVIGAYGYNGDQGRAYVYLGSSSGVTAPPALILTGEAAFNYFGNSVASAGDVNGDGYADLVIGANGYNGNQGRAYVYLGSSSGVTATPARTLTGETTNNWFGTSVAGAGDVNGDGYADLVIGASGYASFQGRAYVYAGSAGGAQPTPVVTLTNEAGENYFGAAVASAGDGNGDGAADLVIGAWTYNTYQGRAYLYLGRSCTFVENTLDSGVGSLRAAIACAQPGDAITFDAALTGKTITLTSQLTISKALTISSTVPITISGNYSTRVFSIAPGVAATLNNLTIAHGKSYEASGGGILNQGTLTVTDCALDDNLATPAPYSGGGIYNADTAVLTVISSTFMNNGAAGAGAGIFNDGTGQVFSSTFSNGSSGYASSSGAGIANLGVLTVTNSLFTGNEAPHGAGLSNGDPNSRLVVYSSTFDSNTGSSGAGMDNYGVAEVYDSTFTGNQSNSSLGPYGGGIYNAGALTLAQSTLITNSAGSGGGMFNAVSSHATLTNVTFSGNQATYAGGMHNHGSDLTLTNVTFSGNQADQNGGGMFNDASHLTLSNVTFSGNQAGQNGGGMFNYDSNPTLVNCIVWGNAAVTGTQFYNLVATPALSYTLIQSDTNAIYNDGGSVSYGPGILTTDPHFVAPVAASRAPTTTGDYRLQSDSPAIDTGDPDPAACPATDQRGLPRADLRCDLGAFELQYTDSDTVIKTFGDATTHSFGPTWVSVTLSLTDTGALTVTKHLACPGGTCDEGELPATWHITSALSAGLPLTVSFCYTEELAGVTDESSLRVFRWDTDALTWTLPISAGLTVADGCVTLTGIEDFSAWTLKDTSVGADKPTAARVVGLAVRGIGPLLAGLLILGGVVVVFRRRRR